MWWIVSLWCLLLPSCDSVVIHGQEVSLQRTINPASLRHGKHEPVIFEPRPNMQPSGGVYSMLLCYDWKSVNQALKDLLEHIDDSWVHYNATLEVLTRETAYKEAAKRWVVVPRTEMVQGRQMLNGLWQQITYCKTSVEALIHKLSQYIRASAKHGSALSEEDLAPLSKDVYESPSRQKRSLPPSPSMQKDIERLDDSLSEILNQEKTKIEMPRRRKRFAFWSMINSVAIFKTNRRINAIRSKLGQLRDNQLLQDGQIHHLAKYLNMTMIRLMATDRTQTVVIKSVKKIANKLAQLEKSSEVNLDFLMKFNMLETEVKGFKLAVKRAQDSFAFLAAAMGVITTHKINPSILSPTELSKNLKSVKQDLENRYSKLKLPGDFESDLWPMYNIMDVRPIMIDKLLVLICDIPLRDDSLTLDVYKVHNLPAFHPASNLLVNYQLEGQYFAVTRDDLYVTLPDTQAVQLCEFTRQHVCHLHTPLYPRHECRWCICALYDDIEENDPARIQELCLVNAKNATKDLAKAITPNLWAVVAREDQTLTTVCPKKVGYQRVTPPMTFVNLSDGCYAHGPTVYLPPQTHVSQLISVLDEGDYLQEIITSLGDFSNYQLWQQLNFSDRALGDIINWREEKLPFLPEQLPLGILAQSLETIDLKENAWYQDWTVWVILVACVIVFVAVFAMILWVKYKSPQKFCATKPGKAAATPTPQQVVPTDPVPDQSEAAPPAFGRVQPVLEENGDNSETFDEKPPQAAPRLNTPLKKRPVSTPGTKIDEERVKQVFAEMILGNSPDDLKEVRRYLKYKEASLREQAQD